VVKRYIAVDLHRRRILLEAKTHAELNKIILDRMDSPMWLYKIDEDLLGRIKTEMKNSSKPFGVVTLKYKNFGGANDRAARTKNIF
jgi:hypothetical protein